MSLPRFVDAHMHLWQLDRLAYPWLRPPFADDGPNGSVAAIAHDYDLKDYFVDAGAYSPVKVVHIDAGAGAGDCAQGKRAGCNRLPMTAAFRTPSSPSPGSTSETSSAVGGPCRECQCARHPPYPQLAPRSETHLYAARSAG
ncbi:MAG: hypothetical protein WDN06_17565 [Asticcacaulis sp.]